MSGKVLVACKIFEDELNTVLQNHDAPLPVELVWVDAGLHSLLPRLEAELGAAIDRAQGKGSSEVKVLFGRGCLPAMDTLLRERGLAASPVNNCLAAFLGEDRLRELEQGDTMVMTPSWVRVWPDNMRRIMGWDEVDFRTNLGRYERILVIDPGINPLSEEEILEFFDLVQVPVEVENISLDYFGQVCQALFA